MTKFEKFFIEMLDDKYAEGEKAGVSKRRREVEKQSIKYNKRNDKKQHGQ